VTIESSSDLQAMVYQPQYERVELVTRRGQRKKFTCGREVKDVKEDLVSFVSPCVRALAGVLCDKARLTSFGKAKMPFWVSLVSAVMICRYVHRYLNERAARSLGSSFRSKVMQVDDH
jgi:hypothetical protein